MKTTYLLKQMKQFTFATLMASTALLSTQSFAGDRVGNGGDRIEQRAKVVINEISDFFTSELNQMEFPEVDFVDFKKVINEVEVISVDELLHDKFGNERCLRNYDKIIEINKTCWKKDMNIEKDQYAILFHELLGLIGLETAGKYIPSNYSVSSRLENHVHKIESYGLLNLSNDDSNLDALIVYCNESVGKGKSNKHLSIQFELGQNMQVITKETEAKRAKLALKDFGAYVTNTYRELFYRGQFQQVGASQSLSDYRIKDFVTTLERDRESEDIYLDKESYSLTINTGKSTFEIPLYSLVFNHRRYVGSDKGITVIEYKDKRKKVVKNIFKCKAANNISAEYFQENSQTSLDPLYEDELSYISTYFLNF